MIRFWILDGQNKPVEVPTIEQWGEFFHFGPRFVAEDYITPTSRVTDRIRISTVFLGLDHRLWGEGPPLLFETMIFGGPDDGETWRYSTWDDAEAGHKAALKRQRQAVKSDQ